MADIQEMAFADLVPSFQENSVQFAQEARNQGYSLSRYLEMISPPGGENEEDKGHTFNRILKEEDMAFISDPQSGFYASRISDYMAKEHHRLLFAELAYSRARRQWYRKSRSKEGSARQEIRNILLGDDNPAGSMLMPFSDRVDALLDEPITPAIPLNEILAFTTFIDSRTYRALYFERDTEATRSVQIAEGTDIPTGILKQAETIIDLPKRGRGISISDEVLRDRNIRIDRLLWQIEMISLEAEVDRVEDAVTVLQNGDGNALTVPKTLPLTTIIDGETGTTLTKGWTAFRLKFRSPFMLTRILTREKEAIDLAFLTLGTQELLQLILAGDGNTNGFFSSIEPINDTNPRQRMGIVETVTDGHIIGFDHRLALERVVEIGSEVQEMERYARNQTNFLGITENSNFAIFQDEAIKKLNTKA